MYEGRGWNTLGAHSGPTWNPIAIGISFMGNYMGKCPAVSEVADMGSGGWYFMVRPGWEALPPTTSLTSGVILFLSLVSSFG